MEAVTFEDLDTATPLDSRKPFFAIDYNNEEECLAWLKTTLTLLQANSWDRLEKVKNNYLRYKGVQYQAQLYQSRDLPESSKRYTPQMVMPLIRDAMDEKVARIMESKPSVTVLPKDDEERDKVDAKIAKRFLSHIDYQEKMQDKLRNWLKNAQISGETFLLPRWNPDKGDVLQEMGILDNESSNPTVRRRSLRIGDVEIKLFTPHFAFYEEHPSKNWDDVNYVFLIEYEYTEGLKQDHPNKAGDIRSEAIGSTFFDFETMNDKSLEGFTKKVTFYHKSTKYLPEGFEAVFVNGALLKSGPLPTEYDGALPPERLIVAKNEEELHGESSIEAVRGIASQVNNYENLIIKQLMLLAHAKWFVEDGSVDDQQLNNDNGIVTIKRGAKAPVVATSNPVSPQIMEHSNALQEKFYMYAKSNSVVRGEPPQGVSAFVALQYVSEAESRRLSTEVAYFSEGVISLYQKILNVCSEKYKPGEERTMMVAGKDNKFNMMKYDPSTLKKKFSVVLQNTTGLPDSKSGRIQAILETEEKFPGMIPREQVVETLGFAQSEKFFDVASSAARAAEEENELLLDGKGMVEPEAYEDHIVHWKIHTAAVQDMGFKSRCSPEVKKMTLNHLLATEMMMMDQMVKSPTFAIRIQNELPQFPMLFTIPEIAPPPGPVGPDGMPLPPDMGPPPPGPGPGGPKPPPPHHAGHGAPFEIPSNVDAEMAGNPRPVPPSPPARAPQPL